MPISSLFPSGFVALMLLYATGSYNSVYGQKPASSIPTADFGQVEPGQFIQKNVDTTAEAVVLYDLGRVSFEVKANDIWMVFTHHVRTLIRKKSAYERATLKLGTRRSRAGQHEYVSSVEGYTYTLTNGLVKTDKLLKTGHFTERTSDTYWQEKYTLPNVQEGSIIEYQYTVNTPFSISSNPRTWYFQQEVPVKWSEYRIEIPDYFYYKVMLGGYLPLALNKRNSATVSLLPGYEAGSASAYQFAVKDAPAFRDEAYITSEQDYLSRIDFELASYTFPTQPTHHFSTSWEAMDKTLLEDASFGRQYRRAGFLRETAKALTSQHADTLGRVVAAYDLIRQTIKWNEKEQLYSENLKKIFEDKKGDAADINLLLIALLREMGLEANPVILSTRSHGRVSEAYALIKKFNYVVAHLLIGGQDRLFDATDAYLKPGVLPMHCLNGVGRLITPQGSRFIKLDPIERANKVWAGRFTITEDGDLTGTLEHFQSGYNASKARKQFGSQGQTKYLEDIRKTQPGWQIEKADFAGIPPTENSFRTTYTLTIPEACPLVGDRFYFRPLINEAQTHNPFKEAERLYPVDFGVPQDETLTATYTLPDGFEIEEIPKPVAMSLPENGGRFLYQVSTLNENQFQVASRVLLNRPTYAASEYSALRELFSQIVAKHAEPVVLKRKGAAPKK